MCHVSDENGENSEVRLYLTQSNEVPNDKVIKSLEEGQSYSVLERDEMMVNEMKDKVKKEYRRVKVLETKFNSVNVFKAINTWAVSLLRYSAAFLGWSRLQLQEINSRTRKLLIMHNGFHPKSIVD